MAGGLTDDELAAALRSQAALGEMQVLVVANKFSSRLLVAATGSTVDWNDLGSGDIGPETNKVLEAAAKQNRLQWLTTRPGLDSNG